MKKILFIFILTLFLQANYNAQYKTIHGTYITFKSLELINECENKIDISLTFGSPSFVIKTEDEEFWIYYYQKKTYNKKIINRYIKITFKRKTNVIIDTSIFY